MEAAIGLKVALDALFLDGIVDRTDLLIVSNNSACGGDVAVYLTGARTRFGSHVIDTSLAGGEFVVRKASTGDTVHVWLNPAVYPEEIKAQTRKILSDDFVPEDIDLFGQLQWDYARRLVNMPLRESFMLEWLADYVWPEPTCKDLGNRTVGVGAAGHRWLVAEPIRCQPRGPDPSSWTRVLPPLDGVCHQSGHLVGRDRCLLVHHALRRFL